jgi:pimeloyl-ACP methyl ester carboxylesterase
LDPFYPPKDSEILPKIDLVFVHGLGGSQIGTWTDDDAGKTWISDPEFLGLLKDKVRTLAFGYNANILQYVTKARVVSHARNLLEELIPERVGHQGRPIIFIAHSLGGLVVKNAMLLLQDSPRYRDIKASTAAIIFLGTPHSGTDHAAHLETAQKLCAFVMRTEPSAITQELRTFSPTVVDINESFMGEVSRDIELVGFWESVPTRLPSLSKGVKQDLIVPEGSSKLFGNDARNLEMPCTHTEMPKFSDPEDPRFIAFWKQLNLVATEAIVQAERSEETEARFTELSRLSPPVHQPLGTTNAQSRPVPPPPAFQHESSEILCLIPHSSEELISAKVTDLMSLIDFTAEIAT